MYFPVCFTPKNITPCRTKNYIILFLQGWNGVFERGNRDARHVCVLIVVNRQLDDIIFSYNNNFCAQIIHDNIVIGTHGYYRPRFVSFRIIRYIRRTANCLS